MWFRRQSGRGEVRLLNRLDIIVQIGAEVENEFSRWNEELSVWAMEDVVPWPTFVGMDGKIQITKFEVEATYASDAAP